MGIFSKFNDLVRAQLNDWLDKAEQPEKLHAQRMLDLEDRKKAAERLLIEAMASLKLSQKKRVLVEQKLEDLPKESSSYAALFEEAQIIEKTAQEQEHAIATLRAGLKALEHTIRHGTTRSTPSQSPEELALKDNALNDNRAFATFERMEEKIETNEAELEALEELFHYLDSQKETPPKTETESDLEEELSQLKKKLKND